MMKKEHIKFILFLAIIALIVVLGQFFAIDASKIESFFKTIPLVYSIPAFVFLYIGGTFLIWYLKDPLKIIGAVLFGAYLSTLLIYVSEIINSLIFFNLSKILGKDFVDKKLSSRFKNLQGKLKNINIGWIFILRAIPLIPFRVLDLSFGLTGITYRRYIIPVLIASLPRIFLIQFILAGARGFTIDKISEYYQQNLPVFFITFIYFVVTIIFAFKLKRKLK